MKIFVVNLDERLDRLSFITDQLSAQELEFERFSAVLGKEIYSTSKLFNHFRFKLENRQKLVAGELGCAASHIEIWKKILNENLDYAVVLEDDVYVTKELKDVLKDENLFSKFDYLKIDDCHFHDYATISGNDLLKHDVKKYDGKIFNKVLGSCFSAYECDPVPYGTGGYIISKYAAKCFLKASLKMYYPIDLLPRYCSGLVRQGFLSHAFVIPMDVADSDIGNRKKGLKFSLFERISWFIHKLLNRRRLRELYLKFMY